VRGPAKIRIEELRRIMAIAKAIDVKGRQAL